MAARDVHDRSSPALVDRRRFVKGAAIASAAAVLSPAELSSDAAQDGVSWRKAPCRLCGVGCGLLVGIQRGRAVAARGDPESPVSGGMACVKGYYAIQALYGRDRIRRALVRRDGAPVEVTLREALDQVANRIRDTVARHGPDSVAVLGSDEWTVADALVAARLFRGAVGTRCVDTTARLYTASADAGLVGTFGHSGAPGSFADFDEADTFVLWNVNMAETDPVLFSRVLERRRTNPAARIINLATRTTRTSYAADRTLLCAPQSELAIANAICQDLVVKRMVRRSFVDRYVAFKRGKTEFDATPAGDGLETDEGSGADWDAWVRFLGEATPEHAERVSGVAASDIRWLASLYGDPTRKVVTLWGTAVNGQSRGTWLNNALHNVHLLVGKVATPGNAAIPVTGEPGGAALAMDVLGIAGARTPDSARAALAAARGVSLDALDERPGRPLVSIFRALERGEIRFLWIQGGDPMVSLPHLVRYRAAIRRSDCVLVASAAYPTPTTDEADIVLPLALWIERSGEYVNAGRTIQHFDRLIAPQGDATTSAHQMIEVARRLGYASLSGWDDATVDQRAWSELARFRNEASHALPAFVALREGHGAMWPAPAGQETSWRYNTRLDRAADPSYGEFDFHGHAGHRAWIWLRPWEPPPEVPDQQYPFWFSSGSVVEHWRTGSLTRRIPTLHQAVPRAYLEINREDARRLGIRHGDMVRVTSRRGSIQLEARIDFRGQPPSGRVFAPSFDEEAPVAVLTSDAGCPLSGQPGVDCAVRVERVRGRS